MTYRCAGCGKFASGGNVCGCGSKVLRQRMYIEIRERTPLERLYKRPWIRLLGVAP
jgi:DNA-directed RNA polymerase subunit RPC12/RpoP